MRTTAKFLAVAALTALSASSFATQVDWTGTLASVKLKYFPNNSGSGAGAVLLLGTGSPCPWPGTSGGAMLLAAGNNSEGDEARAFYNFLVQAKNAGSTVTLTYDNASANCPVVIYSR